MNAVKLEDEMKEAIDNVLRKHGQSNSPVFLLLLTQDQSSIYATRFELNIDDMSMDELRLFTTKLMSSAQSVEDCLAAGDKISTLRDPLISNREGKA